MVSIGTDLLLGR